MFIRHNLTRRQVLSRIGLGVGAAALGGGGVLWLNGTGAAAASESDQALLGPPVLPVRRPEPDLVEAALIASSATVRVAGINVQATVYNGTLPGPTLNLREGDRVRLTFVNRLAEPMQNRGSAMDHGPSATNLHTHGLHIPPSVDNPFVTLGPGETRVHEFTVPRNSAGTYWYHPHAHGHVAEQQFAGLYGAIVVRGDLEQDAALQQAEEHLLVLSDITVMNGHVAGHTLLDLLGKEGNLLLVNGQHRPTLVAQAATLRLRLVNASISRAFKLQLEGHTMHLIATDGGFLERPVPLGTLLLAPGERAEVMVQLSEQGTYRLLHLPYARSGFSGSGAEPETFVTIVTPASPIPSPLPERLATLEKLAPTAISTKHLIEFGMGLLQGFTVNNRTFDMNRVDIQTRLGALEVWEIANPTVLDHPFHLHSYPFQVLERYVAGTWQPEPYLAWRDTVNLRGDERVRIAVRFADFTGKTVYHCHVSGHGDHGMMGVLEVT